MIDEILDIMKRKEKTMPRYGTEYQTLHKEIRNKCRQAKEEWLNEKCAEIERISQMKQICMKKIKEQNKKHAHQQDA